MPRCACACPHIDSYQFGLVVVDGRMHTKDLIILPGQVLDGWWRTEAHSLFVDDLEAVLAAKPEVLIVGTGAYGRLRVPNQTRQALEASGIEVVAERTEKACRTFNSIAGLRIAAAALHLTC